MEDRATGQLVKARRRYVGDPAWSKVSALPKALRAAANAVEHPPGACRRGAVLDPTKGPLSGDLRAVDEWQLLARLLTERLLSGHDFSPRRGNEGRAIGRIYLRRAIFNALCQFSDLERIDLFINDDLLRCQWVSAPAFVLHVASRR